MIRGVVSRRREPTIPLRVLGMGGVVVTVTATVDTGFNGFLTLPPLLVRHLGLLFNSKRMSVLADGRSVEFDVYGGAVDWHGRPHGVHVEATDGEPLVGMRLLDGCDLWVDCRPGGAVEITPALPPPAPAP